MQDFTSNVYEHMAGAREFNKTALESAVTLGRIAARTHGLLSQQQLSVIEACVEAGGKNLQAATEIRDPQELASVQTEVAAQVSEKLVATVQEVFDIQVQVRDELAQWVQDGFSAVQAKAVPAVAAKPAPKVPVRARKTVKKVDA